KSFLGKHPRQTYGPKIAHAAVWSKTRGTISPECSVDDIFVSPIIGSSSETRLIAVFGVTHTIRPQAYSQINIVELCIRSEPLSNEIITMAHTLLPSSTG